MPAIKLNEDELTALYGLPHIAIVLYMMGLRPRMDFANGTVGNRPLISWQALREAVYVEPHQGIKHEYASIDAVRRAAVWLEKVGLIRRRSHDRQLIFFLPLAHADYSVQKKAAKGTPDQAARGTPDQDPRQSSVSDESGPESRQTKNGKADKHPVSGKDINTSPTPFTTVVEAGNDGAGEGEKTLIFPKSMPEAQKRSIRRKIENLSLDIAQAVIDELAGCIQAGTVKNLPALCNFFVKQAEQDEFMPDKGVAIKGARDAQAAEEKRRAEYERRASEEAKSTVKGVGKPARLADLVKRR